MRSPTRIIAATTLSCEALVVIFAGLVAKDLSSLSVGAALGISAALAVGCLLAAGMLGSRRGYVLGSVLQVLIIGYGFWLSSMFFVGVLFAGLWVLSLVMGTRAEREAERRWGTPPSSPTSSALPAPASQPRPEGE
ncbi:MAG TPA: DUF4233 domain-containing protein [Kineosporiaceae bacterium]|nr:DUF4233 domain-containing protein [Kineosporiaceae bacterium]